MSAELVAEFEKRYPRGSTVGVSLRRPVGDGTTSVTVLFGPSGSGKTTILRSLAGLERPESGVIRWGDEIWLDAERGVCLSPQRRNIGFLFQDYALFPHLTVAQNIGYGLAREHRNTRIAIVGELLERFGIEGLGARYPREISGGQQQRAALARALARKPAALMLDEPLSALDGPTRDAMRRELADVLPRLGIPVFLVTHETREAVALGDYLVVLEAGRAVQQGPVEEVLSRPATPSVARIVGVETVARGRILANDAGLAEIRVGSASIFALTPLEAGRDVDICIRAAEVILQPAPAQAPPSSARNQLAGRVTRVDPEDATARVEVDCGFPLTALLTRRALAELGLGVGAPVTAVVKATSVHVVQR